MSERLENSGNTQAVFQALYRVVLVVRGSGEIKSVVHGNFLDRNVLSSENLRPARQLLIDGLAGESVDAIVTLLDGTHVRVRCVPCEMNYCVTLEDSAPPFSGVRRRVISSPEYEFIVGNMRQGLWRVDANGVIEYVNSHLTRWLETTREAILDTHLSDWMVSPDDPDTDSFEAEFQTRTGIRLRALVARSPLHSTRGRVRGSVDIITDITAEHALRTRLVEEVQRMSKLARTDPLTGLANRTEFEERYRRVQDEGMPCAIVLADVDDFKLVNDSQGHTAGDLALVDLAQLLRSCVRDTDLVARIGGDEFAMILPGASRQAAQEVVDRISARTTNAPLKVSLGWVHSEENVDDLLDAADQAMYRDKRQRKLT